MSQFYRSDRVVQDALGNALAGISVAFCSQPAVTSTLPPSPLITLYADPNGITPITNPLTTNGLGSCFAYLASGIYTVVTYGPGVATVILPDQNIVASVTTSWNNDSSNAGTITGAIDGSNVLFTLSAPPAPASSLTFAVNGLVQYGWLLSGSTVTLAVAPHAGAVLNGIYQRT
jgi:hypothetical protein